MNRKKALRIVLMVLGYIFEYAIPLVMFGYVVPLTKGSSGAGLTTAGYIVLVAVCIVGAWKLYGHIQKQKKSIIRACILSIAPIAIWAIAGIGLDNMLIFVQSLVEYWWHAFIFIIIGRLFFVIEEHLSSIEEKDDNNGQ